MKHTDFADIKKFLINRVYPASTITKGQKANFRKLASVYVVEDCQLFHVSKNRKVSKLRLRLKLRQ
jgi:replication initiation and membrane attachment protein DnaB